MSRKEKPSQCTRCSRQVDLNVAFGKNLFPSRGKKKRRKERNDKKVNLVIFNRRSNIVAANLQDDSFQITKSALPLLSQHLSRSPSIEEEPCHGIKTPIYQKSDLPN